MRQPPAVSPVRAAAFSLPLQPIHSCMTNAFPAPLHASPAPFAQTLDRLITALGADSVLTGNAVRERVTTDWSGSASSTPLAIVLPRDALQVALALQICSAAGQPLSIQGGLTGLAGGANPQAGEVALSLSRLAAIEDFDDVGGTVVVQAGVTLEQLQVFAAERDWFFPLDLGARGSCQLGGNAATNAGGNRVMRYGMMRESVLGLEVALANGTLLSMLDRVIKNNAGFDLKQMFIGSEGTLGVITRLSLKLVPRPLASQTVLCAVGSFEAATRLLREARRCLPELVAFELMWDDYFKAASQALGRAAPFADSHPLYVLIETMGADAQSGQDGIERFLEQAMDQGIVTDAIVAQSAEQALGLWAFREAIGELLSQLKPHAAFDISVALCEMDAFVQGIRARLDEAFPQQHLFFGHLGDSNLHLTSGPYADPAQLEAVEHLVYAQVARVGGSISAEHGIGVVKKPFLHCSRDGAQLALMRTLKQALDPGAVLNRHRIFDPQV